ncbi:MAG: small nuclear ribonucleoprotein (Sm) [Vulcanisaeta sp.]|jgi:small nuclear ribonucleoprotein|nr:small nuclear ribonucleoprotein (Sm) [Vulcanisaeta sp.]MCG2880326.1 small nuclear ribonucleoprotein (Sm) [Vulcanisaeta sp.]MCG2893070.1 small nuclear ribonucleoprotein (Sm) [Vulcanisaeta sp.]
MPRCNDVVSEELRKSLNKVVLVKLRSGVEVRGVLVGFDQHLNLILTETEEINPKGNVKGGLMLIRGDTILFISPSQA